MGWAPDHAKNGKDLNALRGSDSKDVFGSFSLCEMVGVIFRDFSLLDEKLKKTGQPANSCV